MGFFNRVFGFNLSNASVEPQDAADEQRRDSASAESDEEQPSSNSNLLSENTSSGWGTLEDIYYSRTSSGENITPTKAFNRITTVFACVDRRATALAKLPFGVYRKVNGNRETATEHRVNYLLTKRPNAYQTPTMYKKYIITCQLLWGFAVILKKYDGSGRIDELIPLKPQHVAVQKVLNEDRYVYIYKGKQYTEDEVIYIPYITADGKIGKSPMSVARESAGAVEAMTKHINGFYSGGALKQGALVTQAALSPAAKKKLKHEWAELYGGAANAGEPAVLDNGLDFKDISLPLKDAEFIESKRLTAQEIASVFNVPPSMIGLSSEKFSNLQEINDRYMQDVVQPDCINIEEAHDFSCFLPSESEYYTKFNLAAGMRGSDEKRANFYQKMQQMGIYSINDILELEDRNSIGELGDKHYLSLNYTTLETLEKHERIIQNGGNVNNE